MVWRTCCSAEASGTLFGAVKSAEVKGLPSGWVNVVFSLSGFATVPIRTDSICVERKILEIQNNNRSIENITVYNNKTELGFLLSSAGKKGAKIITYSA